jgi:tetratricopeptide (TPR) repeat protein
LSEAYLKNYRPVLALQSLERYITRWPNDPNVSEAQTMAETLRTEIDSMLSPFDLNTPVGLQFAANHEETQCLLAEGEPAKARQMADAILKVNPQFTPAINNKGMAYALDGNYKAAVAMALSVLQLEPDNVHALADLVRYSCMAGNRNEALEFAERLKASNAPAAQRNLKTLEALLLVRDYAGILDLYERSKTTLSLNESEGVTLFNVAAFAASRLGKHKKAKSLWKKILDADPNNMVP